jgi:hypothetical protein
MVAVFLTSSYILSFSPFTRTVLVASLIAAKKCLESLLEAALPHQTLTTTYLLLNLADQHWPASWYLLPQLHRHRTSSQIATSYCGTSPVPTGQRQNKYSAFLTVIVLSMSDHPPRFPTRKSQRCETFNLHPHIPPANSSAISHFTLPVSTRRWKNQLHGCCHGCSAKSKTSHHILTTFHHTARLTLKHSLDGLTRYSTSL